MAGQVGVPGTALAQSKGRKVDHARLNISMGAGGWEDHSALGRSTEGQVTGLRTQDAGEKSW